VITSGTARASQTVLTEADTAIVLEPHLVSNRALSLGRRRDGPAGRRAYVHGGPDLWEVVEGLVGGDVPAANRITRAVEVFGSRRERVEAALAYYAEVTEESYA